MTLFDSILKPWATVMNPFSVLLGLLLPLALYLLVVGRINRRAHPLIVPGVWDFIGVLVGVSGFLLFGCRLILDRVADSIHLGWMVRSNGYESLSRTQLGVILSALYFVVVVALVAVQFSRCRRSTSVYNVDPEQMQTALTEVFERLGMKPLRSGQTFFFRKPGTPIAEILTASMTTAVLEIDVFGSFRHVTLIWDSTTAGIRNEVESELEEVLTDSPTESGEVGFWFTLSGLFLLGLALIATAALVMLALR